MRAAARTRGIAAALGGLGLWLSACSGVSLDDRAGLSCVDDSLECVARREATLKSLLADEERKWVEERPTPLAHASGVRLFAFRSKRTELSCRELVVGHREAKAAPKALKGQKAFHRHRFRAPRCSPPRCRRSLPPRSGGAAAGLDAPSRRSRIISPRLTETGPGHLGTPAGATGTTTGAARNMTTATALHAIAFIDLSWTSDFRDWIIGLVKTYPRWIALIVLLLAFGESLAFVSLVFPFWLVLFLGIGPLLAASDAAEFLTIALAAAVGAALGDWLSYWLGYYYHERIQQMWPLRNHPDLIENGRVFFKKWGAWAIVIGRFLGPLRASVPIVAGISEMPWLTFQIANWASAVVWAVGLLALGKFGMAWLLQYFSL